MIKHWVKDGVPVSGDELRSVMGRMSGCTVVGATDDFDYHGSVGGDGPVGDLVFVAKVGDVPIVRLVIDQDGVWMPGPIDRGQK